MIVDDNYLEHYGKKGMKWRNRKVQEPKWSERSGKQKLAIGAAGYGGASIVGQFTGTAAKQVSKKLSEGSLSSNKALAANLGLLGVTAASAYGAIRLTKHFLDKDRNKKLPSSQKKD